MAAALYICIVVAFFRMGRVLWLTRYWWTTPLISLWSRMMGIAVQNHLESHRFPFPGLKKWEALDSSLCSPLYQVVLVILLFCQAPVPQLQYRPEWHKLQGCCTDTTLTYNCPPWHGASGRLPRMECSHWTENGSTLMVNGITKLALSVSIHFCH